MKDALIKSAVGFCVFALMFCLSLLSPLIPILSHRLGYALVFRLLGGRVINFLFFWPQTALMPGGVGRYWKDSTGLVRSMDPFLTRSTSFTAAICFWVVVGLLFAWFTRRLKLPIKIVLVYPVIFLIGIGVTYMMYLIGYGPYLEGP